jgi:hypothetical protein
MPPALLLLGIGRLRRWPLPLPLCLLWPLLALAYLVLGLAWILAQLAGRRAAGLRAAFSALEAYRHLGGLDLQIDSEGRALAIRII